jgi:alkanesulfonate monooxygenase
MGFAVSSKTELKVFSTAPQSSAVPRHDYVRNLIDVARWSEENGCEGILVYTDNSLVDPWAVSQIIIQNTVRLCPLVAVQPAYMHPYWAAKKVSTLAHLYGRRVYLNMLAGGFKNDLAALNDTTPHDKRYARMVEYTTVIQELLKSSQPMSYHGEFYTVRNLRMTPPVDPELVPGILVSGSSDAGLAAAAALGATAVKYPQPAESEANCQGSTTEFGIRVGIIARESDDEAWHDAHARFPQDRQGQLTHQLAMKVSDSSWHKQLSQMAVETRSGNSPYWLWPFENYKTFCPYLVGSYQCVASELAKYIVRGYHTFIFDIPPAQQELVHINVVLNQALQLITQ